MISSLGQVKFPVDKYIMSFTCPWASIKFCYFDTSVFINHFLNILMSFLECFVDSGVLELFLNVFLIFQ